MRDGPTFEISCEGVVIGHSAFEARGTPLGVVRGAFVPAPGYASVAALFRADAVARARPEDGADGEAVLRAYYAARDRLAFAVADPAGRPVPVEYVHVYAPATAGAAPLEVLARLAVPAPPRAGRRRWRSRPAT